MSCRDIHATNAFSFVIALLSLGGLLVATVIPQWRTTRLITHDANARNVTVYDGLWTKCVKREGSTGCYYFDPDWWAKVDQLDLRLLQMCLPTGGALATLALFLMLMGMCKTACCSKEPEDIRGRCCLVNSVGCHLVAGMFLFLGGGAAMPPSVWFLFHTEELNRRYEGVFAVDFAVYVAIGSAGGLLLAALLLFMWYCMCKKLPSPFWLPFPEPPVMPGSLSAQPLTANAVGMMPPSPGAYGPQFMEGPPGSVGGFVGTMGPSGYPASVTMQPLHSQMYTAAAQMAGQDGGYGSEAGVPLTYGYAPSQGYAASQGGYAQSQAGYAPSQAGYAPSQVGYGQSQTGYAQSQAGYAASQAGYAPSQQGYGGGGGSQRYASHRYSSRSRHSGIEIDIPVLTE